MDRQKAKSKYDSHRHGAARRGIGFELTFDQWLEVWGDKLDKIGAHRHQYGMCRVMDAGPYAVGNVYIGSPRRNGHTRKIVYAQNKIAAHREDLRRFPAESSDPSWEEENPWLPDEFQDKCSWQARY